MQIKVDASFTRVFNVNRSTFGRKLVVCLDAGPHCVRSDACNRASESERREEFSRVAVRMQGRRSTPLRGKHQTGAKSCLLVFYHDPRFSNKYSLYSRNNIYIFFTTILIFPIRFLEEIYSYNSASCRLQKIIIFII